VVVQVPGIEGDDCRHLWLLLAAMPESEEVSSVMRKPIGSRSHYTKRLLVSRAAEVPTAGKDEEVRLRDHWRLAGEAGRGEDYS
jgi:hypothetical protein